MSALLSTILGDVKNVKLQAKLRKCSLDETLQGVKTRTLENERQYTNNPRFISQKNILRVQLNFSSDKPNRLFFLALYNIYTEDCFFASQIVLTEGSCMVGVQQVPKWLRSQVGQDPNFDTNWTRDMTRPE